MTNPISSERIFPSLLLRYRSSLAAELLDSFPAGFQGIYSLLGYHMGWTNKSGDILDPPLPYGKVLRPSLCLFTCEALGGSLHQALPAAAALELTHNFSLIHDDIQDDGSDRRHRPTLWRLWGKPKALMAGNSLRTIAAVTLQKLHQRGVSSSTARQVLGLLTQSILDMVEGQHLDLAFEGHPDLTVEDYLHMIALKTGALIQCSINIGAILATDDASALDSFARCGTHLGIAFQIQDDILGIWGTENATGKNIDNDLSHHKRTFPIVYALNEGTPDLRKRLHALLRRQIVGKEEIEETVNILNEVGARTYARSLIEHEIQAALSALKNIPLKQSARQELQQLANFLIIRDY